MRVIYTILLVAFWATMGAAQDLEVASVSRVPFSFVENGAPTGFSIDLVNELARGMERGVSVTYYPDFTAMFDAVRNGHADMAIANISITSQREATMDFSHPIFDSGLQIMIPAGPDAPASLWGVVLSMDVFLAALAAFGVLFAGGMLMWAFERHAQPYFDRPAREAMFPAFWWALNLLVNGGFEERVPRTRPGRFFAVILVISSLFIVSVFVAHITSAMTVQAINNSISSVNDLYGKTVGTIRASTAAGFLDRRDLDYRSYENLEEVIAAFEAEELDAVVFDAPVLAYYTRTDGRGIGKMAGPVFLRESYGIALPSDSPLAEELNQHLLELREDGTYAAMRRKWFGTME